jgi:hypothetical protein
VEKSSSAGDRTTWHDEGLLGKQQAYSNCSEVLATLELLRLRAHVGLGARARETGGTEVLLGLSIAVGSEEMNLLAFGSLHNELVEGEALAASGGDASTGSLSESESGNSQLGDSEDSLIIGDGGNDNGGLTLIRLLLVMLDKLGKRKRRSVHSGGNKSSEDGLVEARTGSSREESEELDEQVNVEVGAPRVFLVRILNSTSFDEINSLQKQ